MCTHSRFIYNPYSRRRVLVPCGKCPACQQQKAQARASKIRNNVADGNVTLFVTLTYANDYVPYIKKSELKEDVFDINVYRNADCRYIYSPARGSYFKKNAGISIVDKVFLPQELRADSEIEKLLPLKGMNSDSVGVCLYSDVQKFYKRLRQILKRDYGYNNEFTYFSCTEYGSHTKRPHSHHLIFVRRDDAEVFRKAIVKAWPYADSSRTEKYIEYAKDAASYVASYVSSRSHLPSCLQDAHFAQKHASSQHFGVALDCFNLSTILDKIDKRDLFYYRQKMFDGTTSVDAVPIPKYILNRYFPWCKGFSRLSSSELYGLLLTPERIDEYIHGIVNPLYQYSSRELYQMYVRLDNAYNRFYEQTGLSRHDYAYYYTSAWRQRSSNVLLKSYEDVDDFSDFYENANSVFQDVSLAPTLESVAYTLQVNPNLRKDVVQSSQEYEHLYYLKDKQRKVTNYCLSALGHNF